MRKYSIDSLNSSSVSITSTTSISSTNSTHLPEALSQFLYDHPPPALFDRSRLFDVTDQDCWFEYFCMSRIPLYITFTVIEQLLLLEEPSSSFYYFALPLFRTKESNIIDSMFKGALMVYFKNPECSTTFDIFSDLNLSNCFMRARIYNKRIK